MHKCILLIALLVAMAAHAQTKPVTAGKKPAGPDKKAMARQDSLKKDSLAAVYKEVKLPRQFMVYTKKPRSKAERMKLCVNLVCKDTTLNYCMNDSLCRDPETSKILFEERKGDTLYVLVYIDGFSKVDPANDDGRCNSGKETKLMFARWNTKTNQAKWKQKNISSCLRGITNMSKDPITDWDKTSVLAVSYHRGSNFYDIRFDPAQFLLGFQNGQGGSTNSEPESR